MSPHAPTAALNCRPGHIDTALWLLADASCYADEAGGDPWQFAVELAELRAGGVTLAAARSLVLRGLAVVADELAPGPLGCRRFRPAAGAALPPRACLVLTAHGRGEWRRLVADRGTQRPAVSPYQPKWDALRRELTWGGELVKRFVRRAWAQELILAAFEEDGWPPRVDDPLPPVRGKDAQARLQEAVKSLNARRARGLIRFAADGTGRGVAWRAGA